MVRDTQHLVVSDLALLKHTISSVSEGWIEFRNEADQVVPIVLSTLLCQQLEKDAPRAWKEFVDSRERYILAGKKLAHAVVGSGK